MVFHMICFPIQSQQDTPHIPIYCSLTCTDHKWLYNVSVTDTECLCMYIRALNQLNALNLPFDTPCSFLLFVFQL